MVGSVDQVLQHRGGDLCIAPGWDGWTGAWGDKRPLSKNDSRRDNDDRQQVATSDASACGLRVTDLKHSWASNFVCCTSSPMTINTTVAQWHERRGLSPLQSKENPPGGICFALLELHASPINTDHNHTVPRAKPRFPNNLDRYPLTL